MRLIIVFLFLTSILYNQVIDASKYEDLSDNEFAEFEDFESDDETLPTEEHLEDAKDSSHETFKSNDNQNINTNSNINNRNEEENDDEISIDDDSEFEHFQDFDEFEGFETKTDKPITEPKITITNVPLHFRANWDSYWLEILMVAGLVVYFANFLIGKNKNTKIANYWLQAHKNLLEDNFYMVGDNNEIEAESTGGFYKESENVFNLWCSGRVCCEGMLVELKLIKRQDLCSILAIMMRPTYDQIHIRVIMNKEDMDSFIFCVASKKISSHLSKEMADLSVYCPERRPGEKYNIPPNFNVMSEISEATSAMLDSKVTAMLNKYSDLIDYIHFSDQYSGPKQQEDAGALKLPDNEKVLLFNFNMPIKGMLLEEAVNQMKPMLVLVFYCIEKVKRYRLSKEGKSKADKNRQRVEEAFLKSTHHARAEAAAARREEKRRLEKEKIMAEEDPERQRRWEEREQKKQAKKRAPKMKQLKVKAL